MSILAPDHNQTNGLTNYNDESGSPPPPPPSKSQELMLPPLQPHAGPMTPMTPTSPAPTEGREGKSKRANPLTDLVETEKAFVEQLTGIIRKVAAAWSRSNLPPKELDTMFRSIEGIYKANRGLHAKLKDISADPRSAGELGGLLINWIDDLKKPYEAYAAKYSSGFDTWQPVQANARLGSVLAQFSSTNPSPSNNGVWTLDSLFLLPRTRLTYYLKLYKRLLKNTQNPLLATAVETLHGLIGAVDSRTSVRVGDEEPHSSSNHVDAEDEIVIDMRKTTLSPPSMASRLDIGGKTGSETSSNHDSFSGGQRSSRESESTSHSRASTQTLSMPISDLERRLSVDRTLDIFTMTPKAVKLQMSPPSLTFTRELRTSLDVVIRFTPRATGVEVIHREGHIFLLSDLFLVCERMTSEERQRSGNDSADMWLCYPPLAGKVLRVTEVSGQDNALQIAIMRKEFIILETLTSAGRDSLMSHFRECIEFSGSLPPPSKQPPPPVPPFSAFPHLQSDNSAAPSPVSTRMIERTSGSMSPSGPRATSPISNNQAGSSEIPPPAYQTETHSTPPDMKNRSDLPPIPQSAPGTPQFMPGPPLMRPSVSEQPFSRGPPFGPNGAIPPARSTSFIPGNNDVQGGPSMAPNFRPPNHPYGGPPFASNSMSNLPQQPMYPGHPNGPPQQQYPPGAFPPPRPPSEPPMGPGIHKSPSTRSLTSQYSQHSQFDGPGGFPPPVPNMPNGYPPVGMHPMPRNAFGGLQAPQARPLLPSAAQARAISMAIPVNEPSPPNSPVQAPQDLGPVTSTISAQMKCKVFLQQHHAQWKSLGSAKLKLYRQDPTNIKQLVVEADNKEKSVLISTIVLTDGVERVGKTGVAIELSDKGARTGIVYMIQLRNETSAGGLFDSLLAGSDRATR